MSGATLHQTAVARQSPKPLSAGARASVKRPPRRAPGR